jgi:hypothetical protein
VLALAASLACATPAATAVGTTDVRVDHAGAPGEDDGIDSAAPVSCMSADGALYVAWQDDRLGALGTWFNASADGGTTFLDEDIQVNYGAGTASRAAIGCDGKVVAVAWEDTRTGPYGYPGIFVNRSVDGGRTFLGLDVQLDEDPGGEHPAIQPAVAVVGSTIYVAYADSGEGAYDIRVRASTDAGETWSPSSRVDTDLAGAAYSAGPRVVADAEGDVLVAWEDRRDGGSDIYSNWSDNFAVSFSPADARVDVGDAPGAAESYAPRLAMQGSFACLGWTDERTGASTRDALVQVSPDYGHSWSPMAARATQQGEGVADAAAPAMTIAEGSCHVAWQDDRGGGYDIFHRALVAGADGPTWATDEARLDTSTAGKSHSIEPVVYAAGTTVLVGWEDRRQDDGSGFDDLYYNASTDGGATWLGEDVRVNSGEPGAAFAVDLGLFLVGGDVAAAWADGRYGSSDVYAMRRPLGEGSRWYPPEEPVDGP